jgi:putative membrane protein
MDISFAAHMTIHMAVVAVAAPLVALGLAGRRADPVRKIPWLFAAIPASLLELVVVSLWHAPDLHEAARHDAAMFVAEQASFLGSGLFLWLSVFGGDAARRTAQAGSAIVALALTFAHMTLLGALLSLSPRPLYRHAEWSAAIADQQLGGAIMLIVGGIAYIAAGLWLGRGLVRRARMGTGGA